MIFSHCSLNIRYGATFIFSYTFYTLSRPFFSCHSSASEKLSERGLLSVFASPAREFLFLALGSSLQREEISLIYLRKTAIRSTPRHRTITRQLGFEADVRVAAAACGFAGARNFAVPRECAARRLRRRGGAARVTFR